VTLAGLGTLPDDDPLFLGMVGMHGAPYTNRALDEADLLVAVGARFDDRATGKVAEFCPRARIVHVDVDAAEIGKIKAVELGVAADAGATLKALLGKVPAQKRPQWAERLRELRRRHPLRRSVALGDFEPLGLLERAAARLPADTIVTTDVGQHQMWVAQIWPFTRPRQLLTSGGLGSMGFGLPAAIGAALARPGTRVVCVSGDGSLLINVQELATLAETRADVTVLLLDNRHLGLVRQQQELFYGRRFQASRFEHAPDFAAIARGFGVAAVDLAGCEDPFEALDAALDAPGPRLVRVPIPAEANVLPMVPPGAANRDMIEIEEGEASPCPSEP
jgi:acetolactate synthase-1/2/3 large subunit